MPDLLFPPEKFPVPKMRGVPGKSKKPLLPKDAYPGCRVIAADMIGLPGEEEVVYELVWWTETENFLCVLRDKDGKVFQRFTDRGPIVVYPSNTPSVIGVGEWAVLRDGTTGECVRVNDSGVHLFASDDSETLDWRHDGCGKSPTTMDIASVHPTREAAEKWIEDNKPKPKRYTVEPVISEAVFGVFRDKTTVVAWCSPREDADLIANALNADAGEGE